MLKKIKQLHSEKDDNLALVIELERDLKRVKEEKSNTAKLNATLNNNMKKLTEELESLKYVIIVNDNLSFCFACIFTKKYMQNEKTSFFWISEKR